MAFLALGAFGVGAAIAGLTGKCLDLGVMNFGCDASNSTKLVNKLQQSISNTVEQSSTAKITQTSSTFNTLSIKRSEFHCKTFSSTQTINKSVKFVASIDQKTTSQIGNVMKAALDNSLKQISDAQRSFLNGLVPGKNTIDLQNDLNLRIDNAVKQQQFAEVMQASAEGNTLVIEDTVVYGDDCTLQQNTLVNLSSNAAIKQVIASLIQNDQIAEIINRIEQEKKGGGINWTLILGIFFGVIALVIVIAILSKVLGKKSTPAAASGGGGSYAPPIIINTTAPATPVVAAAT
jgi:hypothetical protein